jgi:hypothetical protein
MMRGGCDALLTELATGLALLQVRTELELNEQLKIRLQNIVQKCEKDLRGVVRKSERLVNGAIAIEVELFTRLTPLEVSMLKMGIASPDADTAPKWV